MQPVKQFHLQKAFFINVEISSDDWIWGWTVITETKNKISSISDISRLINSLEGGGDYAYDWFLELNRNLYIIKEQNSSKQVIRKECSFSEFFRLLFDESAGCFLNLYETSNTAMEVHTNKMGMNEILNFHINNQE